MRIINQFLKIISACYIPIKLNECAINFNICYPPFRIPQNNGFMGLKILFVEFKFFSLNFSAS